MSVKTMFTCFIVAMAVTFAPGAYAANPPAVPQEEPTPSYWVSLLEPELSCGGDCYVTFEFETNAPKDTRIQLQRKTKNGWKRDPSTGPIRVRDGEFLAAWRMNRNRYRAVLLTDPRVASTPVPVYFSSYDVQESLFEGMP